MHKLPGDLRKGLIANPTHSMPGRTSRLWPATSSSAGSRMPSRRAPEHGGFAGPRRSWKKASVGPVAGRGASTASALADSRVPPAGSEAALRRIRAKPELPWEARSIACFYGKGRAWCPLLGLRDPTGGRWRSLNLCSVFGKDGKIALRLLVPSHSFDGMLPPAFHRLRGSFVRRVTLGDHFVEMTILRLYDLICGRAMVRKITRSTQLSTRHRLHEAPRFLSRVRIAFRHRVPGAAMSVGNARRQSRSLPLSSHHLDVGRVPECDIVPVDTFTACRPRT